MRARRLWTSWEVRKLLNKYFVGFFGLIILLIFKIDPCQRVIGYAQARVQFDRPLSRLDSLTQISSLLIDHAEVFIGDRELGIELDRLPGCLKGPVIVCGIQIGIAEIGIRPGFAGRFLDAIDAQAHLIGPDPISRIGPHGEHTDDQNKNEEFQKILFQRKQHLLTHSSPVFLTLIDRDPANG